MNIHRFYGLILSCICYASLNGGVDSSDIGDQNIQEMVFVRALGNDDWMVRRRAILELTMLNRLSDPVRSAIFSFFSTNTSSFETFDMIDMFAHCGVPTDKITIEDLRHLDNGKKELLCHIIGNRDDTWENGVRWLQELASAPLLFDEGLRISARIALLRKGIEVEKNRAFIESCLTPGDPRASGVIQAILFCKSRHWISEPMLSNIAKRINASTADSTLAAVIVSSMGERGYQWLPAIIEAQEEERKRSYRDDTRLVFYSWTRAIIEAGTNQWLNAQMVGMFGKMKGAFESPLVFRYWFLKTKEIASVLNLLDTKDKNVTIGAVRLCWSIGLPANQAETRLLQMAVANEDEEIRSEAALALGFVGSRSCLPKLKAQILQEKSDKVKPMLAMSIKIISLGKDVTAYNDLIH